MATKNVEPVVEVEVEIGRVCTREGEEVSRGLGVEFGGRGPLFFGNSEGWWPLFF